MTVLTPELTALLDKQAQVVDVATASRYLSRGQIRWQVESGKWQRPCRGIIVTHSGPVDDTGRLWIALLTAGHGAVLAGLTAARLDGLRWPAGPEPVFVLLPAGRPVHRKAAAPPVAVHYSGSLGPADVHPLKWPPRTRIARSLVDAASWMPTDRGARAVLASGVQQGVTIVAHLREVVSAQPRLRRRDLITSTLGDIAGGARALSELDFTRLVIHAFRLPEPDRQRRRTDSTGKNRYLDAVWERHAVAVEIDGAQHMDPLQQWDDMSRDNELTLDGYQVLRFPAWLVRHCPATVAAQLRAAFRD